MEYKTIKKFLTDYHPDKPVDIDLSTVTIDLDDKIRDHIDKYFKSWRKDERTTKKTIEYVTVMVDSWLKHTSSEDFLKKTNLDLQIKPESENASQKHSKKIGFVQNTKTILDEMREHYFFKQIPHLRNKCLSDRYHWYSWPLFSTADKKIDGMSKGEKKKWCDRRRQARRKKILQEIDLIKEEFELDASISFPIGRCELCRDNTKFHSYTKYTGGMSYRGYLQQIRITRKVPCLGCLKKLILLNKQKFSRFLTMLVTSVTRDFSVKKLITSVDGFYGYSSAREIIEDLIKKTNSVNIFKMKVFVKKKLISERLGLQGKSADALIIAITVIYFYFGDNVLDLKSRDWIKFCEVGIKKAYVIEDIYDISDMDDETGEEYAFRKVGLDTHLIKLVDMWGWAEEYSKQTTILSFFGNGKERDPEIQEKKKFPRVFKKWSDKQHRLNSLYVSRAFTSRQDLVPMVNGAIVDVCQLFQEKNGGWFLGIGFLEILSVIEEGQYEDYVDKWFWKEFHFKDERLSDEEFNTTMTKKITLQRKFFYDILYGSIEIENLHSEQHDIRISKTCIEPPTKKRKKDNDNDERSLEKCTKEIVLSLARKFVVEDELRQRYENLQSLK